MKYYIIIILSLLTAGCNAQGEADRPKDTVRTVAKHTMPAPKDSAEVTLAILRNQLSQQQSFLDSLSDELNRNRKRSKLVRNELRYYKRNINNLIKYNKCFGWRVEFLGKTYDAFIVDIDAINVKIFHKDTKGKHYNFKSIANQAQSNGSDLAFAMNAGMFTRERNPQGLYIENGREKFKTDLKKKGYGNFYMQFRKNKPDFGLSNGIFLLSQKKGAHIIFPDSLAAFDKKQIVLATQSGPLMMKDGVFNEHFNQGSKNLNIRNGVGIINSKKVVFVISNEPVNFYEFSQLFRDFFKCTDALYLDGVISQIYAPELGSLQNTGSGFGPILGVIR